MLRIYDYSTVLLVVRLLIEMCSAVQQSDIFISGFQAKTLYIWYCSFYCICYTNLTNRNWQILYRYWSNKIRNINWNVISHSATLQPQTPEIWPPIPQHTHTQTYTTTIATKIAIFLESIQVFLAQLFHWPDLKPTRLFYHARQTQQLATNAVVWP